MYRQIITTCNLSRYTHTLKSIYDEWWHEGNVQILSDMRLIYDHLKDINPNHWYLTDEEITLLKMVNHVLKEHQDK